MKDFLERARSLRRNGGLEDCASSIQDVINAADRDLMALYAKSNLQLENIEDLFSTIEMGRTIGRYGSRISEDLDHLYASMVTFLFRMIEETVTFKVNGGSPAPTSAYGQLAKLLHEQGRAGTRKFSFITFNYDTALEYALFFSKIRPKYFLDNDLLDKRGAFHFEVPVLKLHGSINWANCSHCQKIVPTSVAFPEGLHFPSMGVEEIIRLSHGSDLKRHHHEGTYLDPMPYIVPPTWNKAIHPTMQKVWRQAAEELREAENIVVIGFSLPESDKFFRYLFALGVMSETRIRKFLIIDADSNVINRFRALTGQVTGPCFEGYPQHFEKALSTIKAAITA